MKEMKFTLAEEVFPLRDDVHGIIYFVMHNCSVYLIHSELLRIFNYAVLRDSHSSRRFGRYVEWLDLSKSSLADL